jgi:hypothetical protein
MKVFRLHMILIALLAALMLSCEDRFLPEDKDIIVVEGWIDDGGFPVAIVTRSLPVRLRDEGIKMDDLSDYVEKWAKVTVSDGTNSVVLTGGKDKRYVPGYVYTTSGIRGEAGKTYTLTVETRGKKVQAETTIPQYPPTVDSVVCRHLASDTSMCEVTAYVRHTAGREEYFKSFYQEGAGELQFLSSFLGVVDGGVTDSVFTMPIIKGVSDYDKSDNSRYFVGDTIVRLKISTMDDVSYEIWRSYEDNNRFRSMFMSSSVREVATNVEGGQGYWCGFNSFRLDFKAVPGTYPGNSI